MTSMHQIARLALVLALTFAAASSHAVTVDEWLSNPVYEEVTFRVYNTDPSPVVGWAIQTGSHYYDPYGKVGWIYVTFGTADPQAQWEQDLGAGQSMADLLNTPVCPFDPDLPALGWYGGLIGDGAFEDFRTQADFGSVFIAALEDGTVFQGETCSIVSPT